MGAFSRPNRPFGRVPRVGTRRMCTGISTLASKVSVNIEILYNTLYVPTHSLTYAPSQLVTYYIAIFQSYELHCNCFVILFSQKRLDDEALRTLSLIHTQSFIKYCFTEKNKQALTYIRAYGSSRNTFLRRNQGSSAKKFRIKPGRFNTFFMYIYSHNSEQHIGACHKLFLHVVRRIFFILWNKNDIFPSRPG